MATLTNRNLFKHWALNIICHEIIMNIALIMHLLSMSCRESQSIVLIDLYWARPFDRVLAVHTVMQHARVRADFVQKINHLGKSFIYLWQHGHQKKNLAIYNWDSLPVKILEGHKHLFCCSSFNTACMPNSCIIKVQIQLACLWYCT